MKDKATERAVKQLREYCRLKHLAYSTEKTYTHWLRRYCTALRSMPASWDSRRKVENFLSGLARSGVSASTQNQAFNALLCFYRHVLKADLGDVNALRAKRRNHARYAPTQDETRCLLESVQDTHNYPTRLIVHMLYGCGLRVSEPLNIRIKDVDLKRRRLTIRDSKSDDRLVGMPAAIAPAVTQQIEHAKIMWTRDQQSGIPVPLPKQLARKSPASARSWGWYWLFPAHKPCKHPRAGETVRWRCHESNVQRCVRAAAKELGMAGIITPHCLRHAYATHMLEQGHNPRDVQAAMGHKSLETTMVYIHPHADQAANPLDAMHIETAIDNALQNA